MSAAAALPSPVSSAFPVIHRSPQTPSELAATTDVLPAVAPVPAPNFWTSATRHDAELSLGNDSGNEALYEQTTATMTADATATLPPKDEHLVLLAFAERFIAEHDAADCNDDMSNILSMVYYNEYRRLEQQPNADETAKLVAKKKAIALARKALGPAPNGYNGTSVDRIDATPPLDKVALYLTVSALPSGPVSDFDDAIINAWALLKDLELHDETSIAAYFNAHFPFLSLQTARLAVSGRSEDVYMSLYHALIVANACSRSPAAGVQDPQYRLRLFLHRYLGELEALQAGDKTPSEEMAAALKSAAELLRIVCMMAPRFDDERVLTVFWGLYDQYREFIVRDRTTARFEAKALGWLKGEAGPLNLVWTEL